METTKMEVLPEEMQELCGKQQFKECPEGVYHIPNGLALKVSTDYGKKVEALKATVEEAASPSLWERRLNVENELLRKMNENVKCTCMLQVIAVEFVEKLPIFPITTSNDYPAKDPPMVHGVYLLYYVGKTSLYGDRVSPSRDQPIYIGMSENNILHRLKYHCDNVAKSKDLEETDFKVRFLIVDIKYYAPCIEHVLIEYYNPLWNNREVGFRFGKALDEKSNWYKYHVAKDEDTRKQMIERVKEYQLEKQTQRLKLTPTPL